MELNLTGGFFGPVPPVLAVCAIPKIVGSGASAATGVIGVPAVPSPPVVGPIARFPIGPRGSVAPTGERFVVSGVEAGPAGLDPVPI